MKDTLQDFTVPILLPMGTGSVDVVNFNGSMAICTEQGAIIITKRQAADFFGLVDDGHAQAWQPIETAPISDKKILIYDEGIQEQYFWMNTDRVFPIGAKYWKPLSEPPNNV